MHSKYQKSDGGKQNEERAAELWSYKPANPKKLQRLIDISVTNIAIARGILPQSARIEPVGQVEEVLDRVSAGGGSPVPLFTIQGDPTGKGFISQVPPRFHELRHRYGFQFGHEQSEEKSWWWLILDDSGLRPKITQVERPPERDNKAKTAPAEQPKPLETLQGKQEALFGDGQPELRSAIGL